jgi:hypothetical protein
VKQAKVKDALAKYNDALKYAPNKVWERTPAKSCQTLR